MLKYSTPELANFSAISFVVTTADTGWPLPIGLPSVTISGHTPTQQQVTVSNWAYKHTHTTETFVICMETNFNETYLVTENSRSVCQFVRTPPGSHLQCTGLRLHVHGYERRQENNLRCGSTFVFWLQNTVVFSCYISAHESV